MFVEQYSVGEPQARSEQISEAKRVLLRAEARLVDPRVAWVQRNPSIYACEAEDCLESAILRSSSFISRDTARALYAVRHVIDGHDLDRSIPEWNDRPRRTFSEVMAVLAEAIEIVDEFDPRVHGALYSVAA